MTEAGADIPMSDWDRACLALHLLAVDPDGLGGLTLRARVGPVRDRFLGLLDRLPLPSVRVHPQIGDEALFGGLDLAQTLARGHNVQVPGLTSRDAVVVLAMAERCTPDLAARLARVADEFKRPMILLDEGAEPDERAPAALRERMAFHVDLDGIGPQAADVPLVPDLGSARARYARCVASGEDIRVLTALAAQFGIDSLRAPMLALRVARATAALNGRAEVASDDIRIAAELVYPARATRQPEPPETEDTPPDPDPPQDDQAQTDRTDTALPEELLVDAIRALLPEGLLESLAAAGQSRAAGGGGAGRKRKGNRRGRPLPSRPGRLDGRNRVDLVATLQACAPWQTIRRKAGARGGRIIVHPSDIRVRRFQDKSDRLLVFVVDASGSAAVSRLAEAKGAVELLLAQSYAQRDHVALIGFRGTTADLLLPPTRSLVQTKRRLAALPGGGGTPLATGLEAAAGLADHAARQGLTPTLILLTDGRANIALSGAANRALAQSDAERIAVWIRAQRISGLVLDIGNRPHPPLQTLSARMGAGYVPLPRADARRMSDAIGAGLTA